MKKKQSMISDIHVEDSMNNLQIMNFFDLSAGRVHVIQEWIMNEFELSLNDSSGKHYHLTLSVFNVVVFDIQQREIEKKKFTETKTWNCNNL